MTNTRNNQGSENVRSRGHHSGENTIERVVHAANIHPEHSHKSMDKKLDECKKYFKFGFFLLPCIWLIVVITLFHEYRNKNSRYEKKEEVRKYFQWSLIGCVVYVIIFIGWLSFYINAYRNDADWAYKIGAIYAIK
uniref:Gamma-secretase subunit PEN-2 n=1 Tax=Strongyloides venezuelensis TaxID=75913 RepID=A0A0K0FMV3_STRVS